MPKKINIVTKIGVGLNAPQTALMERLMVLHNQTEPSAFFANLLTVHDQLLQSLKRNPVGRPRNEPEPESDSGSLPEIYVHPQDLPVIKGIPLSPAQDENGVRGYYVRRGEESKMPADYFTNPDYLHANHPFTPISEQKNSPLLPPTPSPSYRVIN